MKKIELVLAKGSLFKCTDPKDRDAAEWWGEVEPDPKSIEKPEAALPMLTLPLSVYLFHSLFSLSL